MNGRFWPEGDGHVVHAISFATDPMETTSLNKTAAGIAFGAALGVALGAAMGNIGAGIAIGIAIGAAIGASQKKKDS